MIVKRLSQRKAQMLATIAQNLEKGAQPSSEQVDELERLGKLETILKSANARMRRRVELFALSVLVLVLIVLSFLRLSYTSVDVELRATEVRFNLEKGTSATLIPGETGQILTLKKATVSGIETISPIAATNGNSLQLRAAKLPERSSGKTAETYDPSVRLFAIVLPSDSSFAIHASVAYSGNSRGLNLTTDGTLPVKASFGEVIRIPSVAKQNQSTGINQIAVEGKSLLFSLYPADELRELAVFRDLHVSSIGFEEAGRSTILSGTAYVRGRGSSSVALRPSDLLVLKSRNPMLLREITLNRGELKVIASVSKATTILLGEDSPRDLRPTLFQWILYRWPNQLYAVISALIAAWLALRRWWESPE